MKLFLFIIVLFMAVFSGCKPDSNTPCRQPNINAIGFSPDESSKFPFTGQGDTLRYTNTNGDSIACFGANMILYYKTFPLKNNPDCPDDSLGFTIHQYNYADTLNKLHFAAKVSKFDSLITINVNNSMFYLPLLKIGVNDSLSWFDSLQFGNRMFYGINSYMNANGDSLYFNSVYGMIGFKQGLQRFYVYSFNNK